MNSITGWIAAIIPSLLVGMSGIFKFSGNPKLVEKLTRMQVNQYIKYLGIAEIIFAILFLLPATSNIGLILLVGYFSGALALDLSYKDSLVSSFVMLSIVVIGACIRNPSLFF